MNNPIHCTTEQLLSELQRRLDQGNDQRIEDECGRLESEVRRLSTLLQESEGGKSQFLSNVRNEINNPLTSILGLANTIVGISTEEKVKRMSGMIYQQAFELDFQMRNIIGAAEIEMGEINPMCSRVNIAAFIEDQVNYLKSKTDQLSVMVKVQLLEPITFPTDANLLQIIFVNLLANAIEYSGRNKVVMVEAAKTDDQLSIVVRDFGSGIDEEKQKLIFDRFRQAETGLTKSHPGHGLGLAIVYELVTILGGTIDLKSSAGQGTTVSIQIPSLIVQGASGNSESGNELIFSEEAEF